jgi:putative nucleotidyltransferase with HDIG domain
MNPEDRLTSTKLPASCGLPGTALPQRVLVVDDDPAFRRLLGFLLAEAGIEHQSAANGEEALERLAAMEFSAILCDLTMPGMSGRELLEFVHSTYPKVAFFVITGHNQVGTAVELMQLGAEDYLVKPFEAEVVIASLRRGFHKKCLEQEVLHYRSCLEQMVSEKTEQLRFALARVEESYDQTLEALGSAIDLRDSETAGHSRRVCLYSLEIARAFGCSSAELVPLGRGAWLHDIGKLALPDSILLKPGPLSPIERTTMQTHVTVGYELVSKISFLSDAVDVVLNHHERYDGQGYARKLGGKEIPLPARIFSIADALDAMTSNRPYQTALPFDEASKRVRSGAGTQFDPEIAEAFLSLPLSTWMNIRRESLTRRTVPDAVISRTSS